MLMAKVVRVFNLGPFLMNLHIQGRSNPKYTNRVHYVTDYIE